ncbi:MAG: prephenate dehydrogenase [Candidatus Methylomirabilia bacterium]
MIQRLVVVGLGLLGGSVAKAARERELAREIVAVGRRAHRLTPALRDGIVDRATADLADGVDGADFVLLALPVATLEALLPEVWTLAPQEAVLTDVGSTKAAIVRTAERLGRSHPRAFVGGHPMAGSEKSGYAAARVDLFAGATVILTPTELTDPRAVKCVGGFWEALGARVATLDPDLHDRVVAAVSHLPHLLAFALVDAVAGVEPAAMGFAARGFKDTTRIAASEPQLWREIFLSNRSAMAETLAAFRAALGRLEQLISAGDATGLDRELARIRAIREVIR